jgi:hypothetical protein
MTVYLPSLFGEPGRPASYPYVLGSIATVLCVRREFALWSANRSSPIIDWLRALARRAHKECGGRGVGAIGLCLTGGFAIAMMTEPKVIAPALHRLVRPTELHRRPRGVPHGSVADPHRPTTGDRSDRIGDSFELGCESPRFVWRKHRVRAVEIDMHLVVKSKDRPSGDERDARFGRQIVGSPKDGSF